MSLTALLTVTCATLAAVAVVLRAATELLARRVRRELDARPIDPESGLPDDEALDWALLVERRRAARSGGTPAVTLVSSGDAPTLVGERLQALAASGIRAYRITGGEFALLAAAGIAVSAKQLRGSLPDSWVVRAVPEEAAGSVADLTAWRSTEGDPA